MNHRIRLTCTVWTCGDCMTEGWAAWMTPWTCTVCPLGSWTSVTVGAVADACAAAMETCVREVNRVRHRDWTKISTHIYMHNYCNCWITISLTNTMLTKVSKQPQKHAMEETHLCQSRNLLSVCLWDSSVAALLDICSCLHGHLDSLDMQFKTFYFGQRISWIDNILWIYRVDHQVPWKEDVLSM